MRKNHPSSTVQLLSLAVCQKNMQKWKTVRNSWIVFFLCFNEPNNGGGSSGMCVCVIPSHPSRKEMKTRLS